jgi:hypothetical protein
MLGRTVAERRALDEIAHAAPDIVGAETRAATRGAARRLTQAQLQRLARDPRLVHYLQGRRKIDLDEDTLAALRRLFARTGRSGGTYVDVRSASGELAVIEQVHNAKSTSTMRLLRPTNRPGDVTADIEVDSMVRGRYRVEVTTPTGARRGQRGPAREMQPGAERRPSPPANRTRASSSAEIRAAFLRKIKGEQINVDHPGVIVVSLQRVPANGVVLTAHDIAKLEATIASRNHIWELLVVVPSRGGRRLLRVGTRDSGLGLAQGVVRAP